MRNVRSCSHTKLRSDFKCVVLRYRWQLGTLLAHVVDDKVKGLLVLEFGNWSAIPGKGGLDDDWVGDIAVELALRSRS